MTLILAKRVVEALIRQSGGVLNGRGRGARCTNCGNYGHNVTGCPHFSPHRFTAKDASGNVRIM